MYSNKALYYLNQMGIRPWIQRNRSLPGYEDCEQKAFYKLFVFISSTLGGKAQALLKQIMSYVNIKEQELTIIPVSDIEDLKNYSTQIEKQTPLAILIFGLNRYPLAHDLSFSCPVIMSNDLDYLIVNPNVKRKVFEDLNQINQLLT